MCQEILRVRTTSSDARLAGREMAEILGALELPDGLGEYRIFRNSDHPNEVMLVLHWEKPVPAMVGSELARRLVFSMKKHGLVDLSAWIKDPSVKPSRRK